MSEKRLLAVLAFVLGLVAGVLVLVEVFDIPGSPNVDVAFVADRVALFLIAVVMFIASVVIYRGKAAAGGLVNLLVGILGLFVLPGVGIAAALLAIVSGVLGLVAGAVTK